MGSATDRGGERNIGNAGREGAGAQSTIAPGKQVRTTGFEAASDTDGAEAKSFVSRGNSSDIPGMDDWTMTPDLAAAMGLGVSASADLRANSSVGQGPGTSTQQRPLQRSESGRPSSGFGTSSGGNTKPEINSPKTAINKPGFIDHSDGSNLRTGPAEAGGATVRPLPLPPATRVFVSGVHPSAPQWWYVTAFLPDEIVRGYVQDFRVTTDLPEPLAKLHQVKAGDTAESLAVQEFKGGVRDGHDLRYYENVLLKVNQDKGRAGVVGTFQSPGLFGGGGNNVQLVAGHRIWLVSPGYAHALEGVVPDGSLTNGGYAKVKRFAGHITDILKSVTQSPEFFLEVAGEFAQAIAEHLAAIVGIVAGFIAAEAFSAFLAATPTGVGQVIAVMIQLALAAFGAHGMVQAGVQAMSHGTRWLTLAWTAQGKEPQLNAASKEFLKMLVAIAMAALAYVGAKGNFGNALKVADSMPIPMPALAVAGGGQMGSEGASTAVALGEHGPLTGLGASGAMMVNQEGERGPSGGAADPATAQQELARIKEQLKEGALSGKEKSRLRARKNELQEQLGVKHSEPDVSTSNAPKRKAEGLSPGKNFKQHFLDHRSDIEKALDLRLPKLKDGGGEVLLQHLEQGINDGTFKFIGKGTLKKGEESMNIYRGRGLTVVTKESGEWVTALATGEGLDLAIRIVP
jgi:hypothetical protein